MLEGFVSQNINKSESHSYWRTKKFEWLEAILRFITEGPKDAFTLHKNLQEGDVSIDHVIPWSFMYSDDLWNLVYCHKSVNSRKSNRIPTQSEIEKLKQRNTRLYQAVLTKSPNSKVAQDIKIAIDKEYVMKFWLACKGWSSLIVSDNSDQVEHPNQSATKSEHHERFWWITWERFLLNMGWWILREREKLFLSQVFVGGKYGKK